MLALSQSYTSRENGLSRPSAPFGEILSEPMDSRLHLEILSLIRICRSFETGKMPWPATNILPEQLRSRRRKL